MRPAVTRAAIRIVMKIVTGPVIATTGEAAATQSGYIPTAGAAPLETRLSSHQQHSTVSLGDLQLFLQPKHISLIMCFSPCSHSCSRVCEESCDDNCRPSSCDEEVNKIRRLLYLSRRHRVSCCLTRSLSFPFSNQVLRL